MIPDWFDLIIWGHEHKSELDPIESAHGYYITQPGSTVATSLIEGEAVKKHCGILDINGKLVQLVQLAQLVQLVLATQPTVTDFCR